jgi:acyl-CoA synthetase (AMP-forming)/AMP-acid ligase II
MGDFTRALAHKIKERPDFHWLNIIDVGSIESYSIQELAKRVYDYCDFFRRKDIKNGDIILIILKESLDLYAAFFAGIIYGALPAYSFYPSHKQSDEAFLGGVRDLMKYNHVKMVIGFPQVVDMLTKNHITDRGTRTSALFFWLLICTGFKY